MITVSGNSPNNFPTPVTAPSIPVAPATSQTAKDTGGLNQNFNQFLTLLTTQLKNQDPLSPMDSTQFTNQLVSFSGVEQQIRTNDNLAKLVNLQTTSQTTLGLSFIGLNVDVKASDFDYIGSGAVKMAYDLPATASVSTVKIIDKDGNVIHSASGEKAQGSHTFTWDGKDQAGSPVPAGTYTIQVNALNATQGPMTVTTTVPGFVTGIASGADGLINLVIGNQSMLIPLSSVTRASL